MRVSREVAGHEEAVLRYIDEFYEEAIKDYVGLAIDRQYLRDSFPGYPVRFFLLTDDNVCVGVLAGNSIAWPLTGDKAFQEVLWYVDKKCRSYSMTLVRVAEMQLKAEGYKVMFMAHMHTQRSEAYGELYRRLGYKQMETHYSKMLV